MRGSIFERAGAALGALLVQALLLYVLIVGLGVRIGAQPDRAAQLLDFTLPPPPPPERETPPEPKKRKASGDAAPPGKVSRATEVEAPPPVIVTPPPVVAAPTAAEGVQALSGAAPVAGQGTGAGGAGNGNGGGGNGGSGGGGTVLRLLRGDITDRDYPRAAVEAGAQGTVFARWVVGVDGRVSSCTVTRSSGNRDLDETTCRLVKKRFRYAPSRDAQGKPYADVVTGEQIWELYDRPGARREGSTDDRPRLREGDD